MRPNINLLKLKTKLQIRNTDKYGKGVFARQAYTAGDLIYVLSGEVVTLEQIVKKVVRGEEAYDDMLQIGRRKYIDLDKISRLFNHSCDPTAGLRKTSELFALRNIKKGEQLTYDYSATVAPTSWKMTCKCGALNCRRVVRDIRSIPKKQLQNYVKAGGLQYFMKPIISAINRGVYKIPRYETNAMKILNKYAN